MHKEKSSMPIGEIEMKFIKKFSGNYHAGEYVNILPNRK